MPRAAAGPDSTDPVSNVVAALYFAPAVKPADLLARLRDSLAPLAAALGGPVGPDEELDAAILAGDLTQFEAAGEQVFLRCPGRAGTVDSFGVMFGRTRSASRLYFSVRAGLFEPEEVREVWTRTVTVLAALVPTLRPTFALANGTADEELTPVLVPLADVRRGRLPAFVTPYTFVHEALLEAAPRQRLAEAGAQIERRGDGWQIAFVPDLEASPSRDLVKAIASWLGVRDGYLQRGLPAPAARPQQGTEPRKARRPARS
ncbi:hypothetical protein OV203_35810 [Nannocystis sp. ILAH1]|uniref:hypothetical protein n=1 Tax=Nannocystis sp. ILAH1 TaxID=2996789 RepID=UPI00226DD3BF|nr:hypothetical protein [Nannocystis sp. ILAH1]MCY0992561.1 hypothetical protein [Nannocystis sp. ILAH1]